jgi:hypothetical protein
LTAAKVGNRQKKVKGDFERSSMMQINRDPTDETIVAFS